MSDLQVIPQSSIDRLRQQPAMAQAFDKVYGIGAAQRALESDVVDPHEKAYEEAAPERELTWVGRVWNNTAGAALYGAQEAINETVDTVHSFDTWAGKYLEERGLPAYLSVGKEGVTLKTYSEALKDDEGFFFDNAELNAVAAPENTTGKVIGGISQFVAGFAAAGKFTKLKGLMGGFVNGAIADAIVFDPNDANITAMVESFGVDTGGFGELMATDVDDPEWANRLRNVAEGAAFGGVVEMIAYSVRARKLMQAGRADEAADATRAAIKFSREVEQELAKAADEVKVDVAETIRTGDELDKITLEAKPTKVEDTTPRDPDQLELDMGEARPEKITVIKADRARMLTPEEIQKINYQQRLARGVEPQELAKGLSIVGERSLRNFDDVLETLAGHREALKSDWQKTPGSDVERWSTTKLKTGRALRELASLTGEDINKVVERFNGGFATKQDMAAEIVARSEYVKSLMRQTASMADAIAKNEFDPKKWPGYKDLNHLKADYNVKMSLAQATARENQAARASVGRALNAMKIALKDTKNIDRVLNDPLVGGGVDAMAKAHVAAKQAGEPVLSATQRIASAARKMIDGVNTYRINALLSGPGTQEVNFISNLVNSVAIPTQELLGGALRLDARQVRHAVQTLRGQVAAAPDAVAALLRVWKLEEAELDPFLNKVEGDMYAGGSQNPLAKTMRLPTRLLMAMDEFFKQSSYRGRVFADADELAQVKGLTGDDKVKFIKGYIADSFDSVGMGTREDAMLQAQRATFTEELEYGSFGSMIQQMAIKWPVARFIAPFVRTPVNILSTALQHTPAVGVISKRWRDDYAAGGVRRSQAIGKQAIGMALVYWSIAEVSKGNITGAGPSDPRIRKVWLKNNRPYSIKIPQEDGSVRFISYQRYEPMAQLLALTADFTEILQNKYNENDSRGAEGVAYAILAATAENSVNKTFTQGIYDFMTILNDRDDNAKGRALNNMVASFVPNAMNQLNGDEAYREARTMMDAIWVRTNRFDVVDVKRNVLGEVIYRPISKADPLTVVNKDTQEIDTVMEEITRVALKAQSVAGLPAKRVAAPMEPGGAIDLTTIPYGEGQSLYDRWVELTGEVKIGGKTLRQRLAHEMGKSSYKRKLDGAEGMMRGTKAEVISKIVSAYRRKAKAELPELVDIERQAKRGMRQKLLEHRSTTQRPATLEELINN